jgi:hypothetical protein
VKNKQIKGIDFIFKSEPMSEKEKLAFSKFIAERKALNKPKTKALKVKKTS